MLSIKRYSILALLLLTAFYSCQKPAAPPAVNQVLNANVNNAVIIFTGSVATSQNTYTINGSTGSGTKIQLLFTATGPGRVVLGGPSLTGQATFTSATGETWSTNFADSGAVYITTLNLTAMNIAGTFSFAGNETKPNAGASVQAVNSGNFNLTW
ncbi:MAG TPA: DUF6252 family protein [Bacteroidia bacterium]|nr:DUF6252 family protein [Bacteroidia bacterium]